jgi:hypothetical protein
METTPYEFAGPIAPNGTAALTQEVEDRFRKYRDDEDDSNLVLDEEAEQSFDDTIATVSLSVSDTYFRVDPREPMPIRAYRPAGSRTLYLVANPSLKRPDIYRYSAYLAKTREGKLRVWCIRRPTISGADFWQPQRRIANLARTAWWGMRWEEQPTGRYTLKAKPYPNVTDPVVFPEGPLEETVVTAFGDKVIETAEDPRLADIPDLSDAPEFS